MRKWGWFFLGPMAIAFFIGFVWPFIQGIFLSFCDFNTVSDFSIKFINDKGQFALFENYINSIQSPQIIYSLGFTALFAVVSVIVINVFAFAIAYALTQGIKGSNLFRTIFFMPNLIGGVILGYAWQMIFGGILSLLDLPDLRSDTGIGFWCLVILVAWQQIGYMMIIYIAGLQAVPEDMLEAAKIDGANKTQTLFRVIIPNVMPSITICMFLSLTNGFKLFDQNFALNSGLPTIIRPATETSPASFINSTQMLAMTIKATYDKGSAFHGQAQAQAVMFFILVAAIGLGQLAITRKREVQQ